MRRTMEEERLKYCRHFSYNLLNAMNHSDSKLGQRERQVRLKRILGIGSATSFSVTNENADLKGGLCLGAMNC